MVLNRNSPLKVKPTLKISLKSKGIHKRKGTVTASVGSVPLSPKSNITIKTMRSAKSEESPEPQDINTKEEQDRKEPSKDLEKDGKAVDNTVTSVTNVH